MLARFIESYTAHRWVRRVSGAAVAVFAIVLAVLEDGFPPWAWRLLFQVLPQLGHVWAQRGLGMLAPLIGLFLLALTLFVLWGLIVTAAAWMAWRWWRARETPFPFEEETQPGMSAMPGMPEMYDVPGGDEEDFYAMPRVSAPMPVMPKTGRNVRFDVQYNPGNGYQSAPVGLVDARQGRSAASSVYLDAGTALDAGIKRRGQPNEDSLLALPAIHNACGGMQPVGLFAIADGMGGHGNGREASHVAITALNDALKLALVGSPEDDNYEQVLAEAAHTANLAVYRRNRQLQADMGTTLAVALVIGNTAYVANVGDSRVYLYRESDGLEQITRDHSSVARLVEAGAIAPDDVYTHPKRNEIYRSLGHHAAVKIDTYSVPLQVGDLLLLCSDGLWEMARDTTIERIVASSLPDVSQVCDELRQAALDGGGKDNISIVGVCVRRA